MVVSGGGTGIGKAVAGAFRGPAAEVDQVERPGYIAGTEFFGDSMAEERHRRLVSETMNGRPGTADDVAGAVAYRASAEAAHVTAQVIQVNCGALPGRW